MRTLIYFMQFKGLKLTPKIFVQFLCLRYQFSKIKFYKLQIFEMRNPEMRFHPLLYAKKRKRKSYINFFQQLCKLIHPLKNSTNMYFL